MSAIKLRCKTGNSIRNKKNSSHSFLNLRAPETRDLGLKGSNMQINIRLGSDRSSGEASKRTLGISECKSEDCLPTTFRSEPSTTRKIFSDRPATAAYGMTRQHRFASLRREMSNSATTREEPTSPISNSKLPSSNQKWTPRSSQSWSSSVDSELATVGSFETEGSSDDKQSFAVFNSASCDSRDDQLLPNAPLGLNYSPVPDQQEQVMMEPKRSNCHYDFGFAEGFPSRYASETERNLEHDQQDSQKHPSSHPNEEEFQKNIIHQDTTSKLTVNTQMLMEKPYSLDKEDVAYQLSSSSKPYNPEDEECSVNTSISGKSENSKTSPNHLPSNSQAVAEEKYNTKSTKSDLGMLSEIFNLLDSTGQTNGSPQLMVNSETESNGGGVIMNPSCDSVKKLHGMNISQLTEEVLGLQMLLQDKESKLSVMERAFQHQKELLVRNIRTAKHELNLRCKAQKEEYEATLNRHIQFIQQLVEEKKNLAVKCEAMATEMRQQTVKLERERKLNEERLKSEMRRLKQNLGKDQRNHQEKWLADRTEHIREATARGLEPELRRLMNQHQTELQTLRSIHQEELARIEQVHLNKTVQQLNALREKMDNDREEACAKEREMMRTKYDKQLDEMEAIHATKYQRLQSEIERERVRWLEEESRMKLHEEERIRHLEDKRRREKVAAQQLLQAEIETLKVTHSEHVAQLKKKWEENKSEEITSLKHTLEINFNERERHLIESHRKEREEEAQKFSAHFAKELERNHEQWKITSEQQIQRIREKCAEEIKRLDQIESELRRKLTDEKLSLSQRDEELASLRLTLFQQVKENDDIKKMNEKYSSERSDLRKVLQKELDNEFLKLNEEKRQLQEEISHMRSEHRIEIGRKNSEIAQLSSSHEQILGEIHEKVKHTVSKKDEALAQMQERLKISISKCHHLEELLDRQQQDLLRRKN